MVIDSKTGKSIEGEERTSTGTFPYDAGRDEVLSNIQARIATWTFLPQENEESIRILRCEKGQKSELHQDVENFNLGGHKVATALMYLSDVEKGGETVFPKSRGKIFHQDKDGSWSDCSKNGFAVKPKKGDALLFFNLHPNGTTVPDSLHGSCPVVEGEKWSATKWIPVRSIRQTDGSRVYA